MYATLSGNEQKATHGRLTEQLSFSPPLMTRGSVSCNRRLSLAGNASMGDRCASRQGISCPSFRQLADGVAVCPTPFGSQKAGKTDSHWRNVPLWAAGMILNL